MIEEISNQDEIPEIDKLLETNEPEEAQSPVQPLLIMNWPTMAQRDIDFNIKKARTIF